MKHARIAFIALLMTTANICLAQLTQNGYYRVLNERTNRYITLIDNTAKVSTVSTSVDLGALQTIKGFDNVVSDPASIIYIRHEDSGVANQFSLAAQGTDTKKITGQYLTIQPSSTNRDAYWAGGNYSGMQLYLNDVLSYEDISEIGTNSGPSDRARNWYILPVNKDIDNQYFGIKPDVAFNGKYYATILAYFPFNLGEGMKAYSISLSTNNAAVYKEITGTIPMATPVLIECTSPTPDGNRIDIVDKDGASVSSNKLVGLWFCSHKEGHVNRKEYDATTMRVIGLTKEGKLGFVKASQTYLNYDKGSNKYYLPANKAYLPVSSSAQSDLLLVSEEEYAAGISNTIYTEEVKESAIYTLTGTKIGQQGKDINTLPKGMYIVNGKKVIVQ